MPQFFENAVMTNAGASLVAKAMNEDIAIDIIALVVGDGSYTNQEKLPEALKQRTTLKSQKVAYTPRSVTRDNNAIRLSALVTNVNPETHQAIVTSGFYINEIGIIAQPSDESTDPILLSICVTAEIRGDYMPAYTGNNPVQIIQGYVTSVSNNATVSFTPPVNAFALETDLQVLSGNISELSNELLDIKMLGWSVPEDIEIRNYIGSDGKFHQRVDRIDISQLAWELSLSDANCFHVRTDSSVKYKVSNDVKIFCDRYEFIGVKNSSPFYGDDGELSCYAVASSPARELYCHDTSFDTATEFIEGNAGVYLYFELADEVVIDIDGNEAIEAIKRKLNGIPNVIDNLTSTSVTDALSAKQGKNLKDLIDDLPDVPNVVDNLTSTSSTDALSAKQGKVLNNNLTSYVGDLGSAIARKKWNQLIKNGNFTSKQNWDAYLSDLSSVSNNVATYIPLAKWCRLTQELQLVSGHKYFIKADVKRESESGTYSIGIGHADAHRNEGVCKQTILPNYSWQTNMAIGTWVSSPSGTNSTKFIIVNDTDNKSIMYVRNVNVIDLTELFGVGNEPSTVDEFMTMFPNEYYDYCPIDEIPLFTGDIDDAPFGLCYMASGAVSWTSEAIIVNTFVANGQKIQNAYAMAHIGQRSNRYYTGSEWNSWSSLPRTVTNSFTSEDATIALSAKAGKQLKDLIDGISVPSVVDNLTSTSATSALSANQGKTLNDKIAGLTKVYIQSTAPSDTSGVWIQ